MPKTTHSQAAKIYHALAKPYDALAEIFQEGIINETYATKLIAEANAGDQIWVEVRLAIAYIVRAALTWSRT